MIGLPWRARWVAVVLACAMLPVHAEILIGQVAPLSGVLATTGQQMTLGGRVVFDAVNAEGGINGEKIRVLTADDGYEVDRTLRLTRDMVANPKVVALFGFAGTANIAALLREKVLEGAGIALVAPYTGGEPLRSPYNPWIFHVRAGYSDETENMVAQLVAQGESRIAVIYQNDAFGQSGLAGVQGALERRHMQLASAASYERNTTEVRAAVKATLAAQPQAVILIAVNKPAAAFIAAYRAEGGGGQLLSISVVDPAELVRLGGIAAVHGLGITQVVPFPYQPQTAAVREFQSAMARYAPGHEINYTNFEEFLGAKVLVEGLRRAGPHADRARLIAALESLNPYDLGGLRVNFGPHNRLGSRFVDLTVIGETGKLLK